MAATTIDDAKRRRVTREVAELLSSFSKGAVKVADMAFPQRKLVPLPKRRRSVA